MKRIILTILLSILIIKVIHAQITIGSNLQPNIGALLDLKEYTPSPNNTTSSKGLLLPRVSLTNLNGLDDIENAEIAFPEKYEGLMVYNTSEIQADCKIHSEGLYVWGGTKWEGLGTTTRDLQLSGSYSEDVATLKKIMDDNPGNTLDWVIDSSDPNNMRFISGSRATFEERCGEQRLIGLSVMNRNLTNNLDASKATALESISIYLNTLKSINVTGLTQLKDFYGPGNRLESLDLSTNINLKTVYCYGNVIKKMELPKSITFTLLACNSNKIKELDVTGLPNLTSLDITRNEIEELDLSNNVKLASLTANENEFKSIDVSYNTELVTLHLGWSKIKNLNLSNNKRILSLQLEDTTLTNIPNSVTICKSVYDNIPDDKIIPSKGDAIYNVIDCD